MESMLWWWHRNDLYQIHLENESPCLSLKSVFGLFKSPFLNFHITSCLEGASQRISSCKCSMCLHSKRFFEDGDIKFRCSKLNPHLSLWLCSSPNALTFPICLQKQMLTPSSCKSFTFECTDLFFFTKYNLLVWNSRTKCCVSALSMHCLHASVTPSHMLDPLLWLIVWFCTDLLWYSLPSKNECAATMVRNG